MLYPDGSKKLKKMGWPHTGQAKCEWAKKIAPHLDVENNQSESFQVFRNGILNLMKSEASNQQTYQHKDSPAQD